MLDLAEYLEDNLSYGAGRSVWYALMWDRLVFKANSYARRDEVRATFRGTAPKKAAPEQPMRRPRGRPRKPQVAKLPRPEKASKVPQKAPRRSDCLQSTTGTLGRWTNKKGVWCKL